MAEIYSGSQKKTESGIKKEEKSRSEKLKEIRKEVYRLVGQKGSFFSAFLSRPKKLSFENQTVEEKVILLLRRHWITNLRWILLAILMLTVPLFLRIFPPFNWLLPNFRLILVLMWYLFVLAFCLEEFFSWYFSVNIITDERVVDIDFLSLIFKRISDAEIINIEDVTYTLGGMMGTIFNYGSIYIQTAGESREFEFENVPQPALVVKVLQKLRLEEKQEELEGRLN